MLFKMANEKELKQINKHAILVHQLLPENKNSALSYFSIDSIEKVSYDSDGLQIFFKEYDLVVKSILRRKIEVKGSFYKIYPKVTNLTVVGIGPYATNSEIEDIMQYYGFIIDSYRIQETIEENDYKTVSLTNDYRIILDVPEVFAPKLRPIKLPDIRNKTFEVLFFCRFCRNNGHMQFQCPKVVKSSPSSFRCNQNMDISRTSYENDSLDLVTNKDRISYPQSDFCVNKRNSKTYPDYQVKIEKEQNYFSDQSRYCKNSPNSSSSTYHQSTDVFRRMSCEKDSDDSIVRKNASNSSQSDLCADKRNSKTRLNSHEKIEKEQKYFSGQTSYSKNSSNSSSSNYHQNMGVSRRISCEKDSGDLVIRKNATSNSRQSDFCVNKRNFKTRSDSHVKNEKEQNYFPDQNCYSKNASHSSSSTYHQSTDVSRKISCENDSGDSIIDNPVSDFCVTKRNFKTRLNPHVEIEKEQHYFSDQSSYSKNASHSSSFTYHQSTDVSRRISCENNSGDSIIDNSASNFCVNKRNFKTRPNLHVEIEKEQHYFSDQSSYSKNSFHSSSSAYHQSTDVSRRISGENDSGDSIIDNSVSDFCVNKRNFKTPPKFHVEIEKEQHYFSDQSSCSKNSFQSSSFTYHQSTDVSRRISCENDSGDLIIDNNEINSPASDFCVDRRNQKNRPDSHVKTEEEQNYFSDQNCCYRNKSHKNDNLKSSYVKSTHSNPKNFHNRHQITDYMKMPEKHRKDNVTSMPTDDDKKSKDNNSPAIKEQSFENLGRGREKRNVDQHCENEEAGERIQASTSNECSNKRTFATNIKRKKEKKIMHLLSSLLPPNMDLLETKKLINIALNCDSKDIPEEVKDVLLIILKYNSGVKRKICNKAARIFLNWAEAVLSKIMKQEKIQSENSFKDPVKHPTKENEHGEENEEANERIQASTSNECNNKRPFATNSKRKKENKKFMHLLSSLLPPDMDLLETKKLINIALKCDPKDIPEEVKDVLLIILKYNSGVKRKICNKAARIFLNWAEAVLSKIMKQEKIQSENSFKDPVKHPTKENEHGEDGKSATKNPKETPGKRKVTLSLGIKEAISKTSGELEPTFLCNFLNQVRGRKKLFEVASVFTKNIPALVSQLLEVQNTYYKYVQKRGPEEDRDISYIKRLRLRLLQHNRNATAIALEKEVSMAEVSSEVESHMTEVPVKTESDMTEVSVETESYMTEMSVKKESDMSETFVKTQSNLTEMSVKTESDIAEISVKIESDMTKTIVKTESDMTKISVKESDMREVSVKREEEILVKRETEMLMRQSSSSEEFLGQELSSYCLHGASYFTNITQMPFSFTSIKTEVNYID